MSRAVLVVACLVATVGLAAAVNQGVDAARWPAGAAAPRITAQLSAASVPVGGSLTLSVHVTPAPADGVLVWPYVDGKQWGAWGNATSANDGSVDIIMPFPNTGSLRAGGRCDLCVRGRVTLAPGRAFVCRIP